MSLFFCANNMLYDSTAATWTSKLSTTIGHFLWNPPDFSSDDVLSCLWIVFTDSVFQVPSQKIVRRFEILAMGYWVDVTRDYWVDVKWVHPMGSYAWGIQVFCSVWEMRCHLIPRTEQLNTSGITFHGTGSFVHPIPKISTHLFSQGVPERMSLWKQSTDERGHHQKKNQTDSTRNAQ